MTSADAQRSESRCCCEEKRAEPSAVLDEGVPGRFACVRLFVYRRLSSRLDDDLCQPSRAHAAAAAGGAHQQHFLS